MIGDLRLSFRNLCKNPGFSALAVATLALGIGINAAVFTVTSAMLFKGFPLVHANDRLVYLTPANSNCCVSYPDYLDWKAQAKSFDDMAIVHGVGKVLRDENGAPDRIDVTEVSSNTFPLVGQKPILGRNFTPADESPANPDVAILSYKFWETRYGKDPAILGRQVRLNDAPATIVGVMPPGFTFPQKLELWVPLVTTPDVLKRENRATWMAIGRLRDGATLASAQQELDVIGKRLAIAYPATNQDVVPRVQDFTEFFIGPEAPVLYGSLWGAVGFVLLIACANLANLMLARALGRSREILVRIALGSSRLRIVRQLLTESLLLASLGGLLGWWIAKLGVRSYALAMAHKESWLVVDYRMDSRVLAYLVAISIATGLLFGIAPALRISRLDVSTMLKDGGRGASSGGRARHLSSLLVTVEMALAVVLLAGAGVMIRSFLKVHLAEMGVNLSNVLAAGVDPALAKYRRPEMSIAYFDRLKANLDSIPGVQSVAFAESLPANGSRHLPFEVSGSGPLDARHSPRIPELAVSPGYFKILGASIVSGRDFNSFDGPASEPIAIVNARFASERWPNESPIGKRIRLLEGNSTQRDAPGPWRTIVGVSSNIIQNDPTRQTFGPMIYLATKQTPRPDMWVLARTTLPPERLTETFRRAIQSAEPDTVIFGLAPLDERLEIFSDARFYGMLFLILAAIALLLASAGLYAVIAHSVSRRTQEIGIRMAIGATARDIRMLVFTQGMVPVGLGLAIGLAASFAVNPLLKSQLTNISPSDPLTLAATSGVLILSALFGCLIPARRAMRVDPADALRHE